MDMYTVQLCRLSGRLREQARSHSWIVGCQVDRRRLAGRHRRHASSHIWNSGSQLNHQISPAHMAREIGTDFGIAQVDAQGAEQGVDDRVENR